MELVSIMRTQGYSQISHTVCSKENRSKITGYAFLLDDVKMGEDPAEFLLTPVEEPNYVRIEDDVVDDFVDNAEEEKLVINSNIVIRVESHAAIEVSEAIKTEANTSDEEDSDTDDSLAASNTFVLRLLLSSMRRVRSRSLILFSFPDVGLGCLKTH